MRTLHFVKTSVGGTWAWREMRELVSLGMDVHVVLPPGGPMGPRYAASGVTVHALDADVPSRRPHRLPTLLADIRRVVRHVDPDIIELHNVSVALSVRAALGRNHHVPRVFHVPGPLHMEHSLFRHLELASAGANDSWLASCDYTRRLYLDAGVAPERVGMSYYGTDVALYTASAPRTGSLREELGLSDGTRVIGMVAYMYAPKRYLGHGRGLKGHEDLIDAVALTLQHRSDVVLLCVGGAWAGATHYEAKVRAYGHTRCGDRAIFLGTRSDVPRIYPDIDVVVHPSHSENMGGAVESLLMGVPTIATSVGGFPELVVPNVTGWLVPPREPALLSDVLLSALADEAMARGLAAEGGRRARTLFDVRRTAAEVRDRYTAILNGQARAS